MVIITIRKGNTYKVSMRINEYNPPEAMPFELRGEGVEITDAIADMLMGSGYYYNGPIFVDFQVPLDMEVRIFSYSEN